MCCAPVSGREVGHVFQSDGSCQDRGPKETIKGVRVDKTRLGPDDINLQTKELHCNYSVLIVRATRAEYSRRFLRELDEAPGGNNLQYILKCLCIPFFGNQGLHNEFVLEGNKGRSGVMCEGSPYIYPSSKVAASRSNSSRIENGIKVCLADVSWGG